MDFEQKSYNQLILSVNYFLKFLFPNNEFDESLNDVVSMFLQCMMFCAKNIDKNQLAINILQTVQNHGPTFKTYKLPSIDDDYRCCYSGLIFVSTEYLEN